MNLKQLHYFIAVAEELHFGRAAERLRIKQPPLSRQISQLESDLRVRLLARTKRSVVLTEPGKAFLLQARETLRHAEKAITVARRTSRGEAGQLRISTSSSLPFTGLLPSLLTAFRAEYPDVELHLKESRAKEQVTRIHDGETDVGFVRLPVRMLPQGLTTEVILSEPILLAMSADHRFSTRRKIELGSLSEERFIMYPYEIGGLHDWALHSCRAAGFEPRIVQEASSVPMAATFAAAGLGLALVPQCAQHIHTPGVVYRTVEAPSATTDVAIVYRDRDGSPLVRNFVKVCLGLSRQLRTGSRA